MPSTFQSDYDWLIVRVMLFEIIKQLLTTVSGVGKAKCFGKLPACFINNTGFMAKLADVDTAST